MAICQLHVNKSSLYLSFIFDTALNKNNQWSKILTVASPKPTTSVQGERDDDISD